MNDPVSRVDLMSIENMFYAFGAATANALSEDTGLDRETSSCLSAERSDARPGLRATGFTSAQV